MCVMCVDYVAMSCVCCCAVVFCVVVVGCVRVCACLNVFVWSFVLYRVTLWRVVGCVWLLFNVCVWLVCGVACVVLWRVWFCDVVFNVFVACVRAV